MLIPIPVAGATAEVKTALMLAFNLAVNCLACWAAGNGPVERIIHGPYVTEDRHEELHS